jgi:hypothetical protein
MKVKNIHSMSNQEFKEYLDWLDQNIAVFKECLSVVESMNKEMGDMQTVQEAENHANKV